MRLDEQLEVALKRLADGEHVANVLPDALRTLVEIIREQQREIEALKERKS